MNFEERKRMLNDLRTFEPADRSIRIILIDYTNYAGHRKVREIIPGGIWFGRQDPWHPEDQYLLDAYDVQKDDMRTFAVANIHRWGVEPGRQMEIDFSIAVQLQRSMERNARMVNRLKKYLEMSTGARMHDSLVDYSDGINSIIKDEEPTWPGA